MAISVSKWAVVLVLYRAWRLATLSEAEPRLLWSRPDPLDLLLTERPVLSHRLGKVTRPIVH